jgi:hypothetical protein
LALGSALANEFKVASASFNFSQSSSLPLLHGDSGTTFFIFSVSTAISPFSQFRDFGEISSAALISTFGVVVAASDATFSLADPWLSR